MVLSVNGGVFIWCFRYIVLLKCGVVCKRYFWYMVSVYGIVGIWSCGNIMSVYAVAGIWYCGYMVFSIYGVGMGCCRYMVFSVYSAVGIW